MEQNDEPLRIVLSLELARHDVVGDDSAAELMAAVAFSYSAAGIRCDGEISLRLKLDD